MIESNKPESIALNESTPAVAAISKHRNRANPIDAEGFRVCSYCVVRKHISQFLVRKVMQPSGSQWVGPTGKCKDCDRIYNSRKAKEAYRANPAKFKKTYEEKHKERLSQKYGMTPAQYSELLLKQHGGCAVCGAKSNTDGRRLCVDHDHVTGKIRGILCNRCNAGLGSFKDDTNRMRLAISYLEKI